MENKQLNQTSALSSGTPDAGVSSFDFVAPVRSVTPLPVPAPVQQPVVSPPEPAPPQVSATQSFVPPPAPIASGLKKRMPLWQKIGIGVLVAGTVIGTIVIVLNSNRSAQLQVGNFTATDVPLGNFEPIESPAVAGAQVVTVNGKLTVNKSLVLTPSQQPTSPVIGQMYYDQSTNQLAYYNGSEFLNIVSSSSVVQNTAITNNLFSTTGGVDVAGTTNKIPKISGANSLTDSIITDNTTSISVTGNINLISTQPAPTDELRFWPTDPTPVNPTEPSDTNAVEVGVKFKADVSGFVKGIRFYKGSTNTGTHVGSLWSANGSLIGQATFVNETATGWQEVRFASPVAIAAETTYVASYHAPVGQYANDAAYFATGGVDNGPLHALANGSDGGNGVFKYSATSTMPTLTFNSINYWVDVIFTPNAAPGRYQVNGVQLASSDLSNNSDIAKRSTSQLFTGNNTFRSSESSESAFSIQSAGNAPMLRADTLNGRVVIGTTGPDVVTFVLGIKNSGGDPIATNGAMYYNSAYNMFRCSRDGVWEPCADLEVHQAFSQYDEFLGGQTTSFSGTGIGSLGWNALAIGANGSLAFNPTTPTPVSHRPGVLDLTTPAVLNQGTTFILGDSTGGSMLLDAKTTVKTTVAVGATTNQVLRVGLHSQTTATGQPVSGVWWEANPAVSAFWQYCFGNGTVASCLPSGTAIAANSWERLEIRLEQVGAGTSSIVFKINNEQATRQSVTVDTTNRVSPAYSCYTTTASPQHCYWDYFQLKGTTALVR